MFSSYLLASLAVPSLVMASLTAQHLPYTSANLQSVQAVTPEASHSSFSSQITPHIHPLAREDPDDNGPDYTGHVDYWWCKFFGGRSCGGGPKETTTVRLLPEPTGDVDFTITTTEVVITRTTVRTDTTVTTVVKPIIDLPDTTVTTIVPPETTVTTTILPGTSVTTIFTQHTTIITVTTTAVPTQPPTSPSATQPTTSSSASVGRCTKCGCHTKSPNDPAKC